MSTEQRLIVASIAAALSALPLRASAIDTNQQWQCTAGTDGAWACRAVALPEARYSRVGRLLPLRERPVERADTEAADVLAQTMDWVVRERLTPAEAAELPAHCSGAYVEPPMEASAPAQAVFGTVQASADESELSQDPEIARFNGNVTVRQDERRLRADRATYYREEDRILIEGTVQYREPGLLARADSAEIRTAEVSGDLHKARFVMHREHARGEAALVRRNADRSMDLEQGVYTQCEPGSDDWEIAADRIHLDRETGQATARNARLRVKGVPVIYTPYIRFPVDDRRMSGFLWPVFMNSSQNGIDVATPYYFNLAPNYDATLVPRFMNERGAMLGGELRYMNRWSNWFSTGTVMPDDDVYGDSRWLGSLQQSGATTNGISTAIDYTEVSDEDYLRNLGATGLEVKRTTHLGQSGAVSWSPDGLWVVSARAQQYQLVDPALDEPYRILPRIEVSRDFSGKDFAPDFSLLAEYTVFEHKDDARLTGQRLYLEPTATFPMEWGAGFLKPSVGYQSISYNLDRAYGPGTEESPSVGAPLFSLDGGYFLERQAAYFGQNFLQTLEPRAYYLRVGREDHGDIPTFDSQDLTFSFNQLFRNTRFAGHDRIADANQVSLSVTSRLIDDASGREVMSASLGQVFYFEDRLVSIANVPGVLANDSSSAIAAEMQLQPDERIALTGSTLWDPEDERIDEGGMALNWRPDSETIVNVGYRYRRDQALVDPSGFVSIEDIDQVDFSTAFPLGQNWRLLARYQYDLTNDTSLEETAGLEYSSCCWALRMVYQEGVDWEQGRDYGVYVEFVLRGLGSLGKNIDQLLQKSIFGYGEFDRYYSASR